MHDRTSTIWRLTDNVIAASIEVHRGLGPGLLESVYERCLAYELQLRGLTFERQRLVPLRYKGLALDDAYRVDFVVEGCVIVEVKATVALAPIHDAQVLTYLRLCNIDIGLLINFNSPALKNGLRRLMRPGAGIGHSGAATDS
jgi:GxxExxY protein